MVNCFFINYFFVKFIFFLYFCSEFISMSNILFIKFGIVDIVDILLVAFILYYLYKLIKGTAAIRIIAGVILIVLLWFFVDAIKMKLLSAILGQVIGVGVIVLVIVFQPEIRRFLLLLGNRYTKNKIFNYIVTVKNVGEYTKDSIEKISIAAIEMSKSKTGALIVISRNSSLKSFTDHGEIINAEINVSLLKNLFFKDSPLHDGAVFIEKNKIYAAKCILPVSENSELQQSYGLRHRSALGMAEVSETIVIVVSEQTGDISIAHDSKIFKLTNKDRLSQIISCYLSRKKIINENYELS